MNSKLRLTLLFLISFVIFVSGIYFAVAGIDLGVCRGYAIIGEIYISECNPIVNAWWGSLALGILMFICLIFLTEKGWKEQ
jgi:hypothetical protein